MLSLIEIAKSALYAYNTNGVAIKSRAKTPSVILFPDSVCLSVCLCANMLINGELSRETYP